MRPAARLSIVCAAAVALGVVIGRFGPLQVIQDRVRLARALVADADAADRQVVVVRITEAEYRQRFNGRSPLDAETLGKLIEAIAVYKPAVLGVDIDTSAPEFDRLRALAKPPVVWARNVDLARSSADVLPVLGYPGVEHEGTPGPTSGVSLLEADADGAIRSYHRWIGTRFGARRTFTCALVEQCRANVACGRMLDADVAAACAEDSGDREAKVIDYRRGSEKDPAVLRVTASEVLGSRELPTDDQEQWQRQLENKIVILGGSFRASGDAMHVTPLGSSDGAELLAQIVATELRGGGVPPTRMLATGVLIAFETYVLLLIARIRPWHRRLLVGAAAIVFLAVVASTLNGGTPLRLPFFTAVLICIVVLQLGLRVVEHSQAMFVEVLSKRWRLFAKEHV